jgi:branched-chain amino acid transport system permease protein
MKIDRRLLISLGAVGAICLLPLIGEPYYVKFATRVLVFGLAAAALDLAVGFGGLISFGHAAFFGISAYAAGILALYGVQEAFVVWPLAMIVAGVVAAFVGAMSLRTSGIYFIFITLAFAQMIFHLAQSLRQFGGDDGFALASPTRIAFDFTSADPTAFFYAVLALMAGTLFLGFRLVSSRFGQVVQAARDSKRRAGAIGLNVYPYQVALFAISGAFTGLAGALNAALAGYVAPSAMSWIASGDLLVMVILGSAGTLVGPVIGAAIFIAFEQVLSELTPHWMIVLGPILVARVLFFRAGFLGLLTRSPLSRAVA